jgi:hypothetical protein
LQQSKTLAPRFSLLVAALATAGVFAGCDDSQEGVASLKTEVGAGPCALLECTSRVEMIVRASTGVARAGQARACVDGRCVDLDLGACGPGERCEAAADGSTTIFLPLGDADLDDATGHLAAVALVGEGGERVFSSAVEFTLAAAEPGGPGCGRCYQSSLVFGHPLRPRQAARLERNSPKDGGQPGAGPGSVSRSRVVSRRAAVSSSMPRASANESSTACSSGLILASAAATACART